MRHSYDWAWVEAHVSQTEDLWNGSARPWANGNGRLYTPKEQQVKEKAYDEALQSVEQEARHASRRFHTATAEHLDTQSRIVAAFARFSAQALDLENETIQLLIHDFLPVGTGLARWARHFDQTLSMADIIQACRNAWTACGLQPLFGVPVKLTPSILGYSLLYPYSDNYLDRDGVSAQAKLRFSAQFRRLLHGEEFALTGDRETALRTLIALIESQYPRTRYADVYDCLLAIHQAQEQSIRQLTSLNHSNDADVLRVSCGKGGSSVLADACLARGWMTGEESRFAFEWGVLLQLGDDLQDVCEDMRNKSVTLFSRAAGLGKPLDGLAIQLLNFSEEVATRMDRLPNAATRLTDLLKMSWRSLIVRAIADSHHFFSTAFLAEAERCSPFRFPFLRARQQRLLGRQGLYACLFEAFLQTSESEPAGVPLPLTAAVHTHLPGYRN